MDLYRGYVETKDKECIEKFKGRSDLKTLEDVQDLPEYAGVLAKDVILIDIDDQKQSEILMQIVDDMQLDCRVIQTSRGRHFLFRNTAVKQCYTKVSLAIGLKADIKVGTKNSYEVLKYNHEERFIEWDIEEGGEYQELPKWLQPLKRVPDFLDMGEGDGRNQELFNYILNLQTNDFNVDESRETIRIINKYILKSPLPDEEIETVLRDDAFQKPVFYKGSTFLFDKFANYLKARCHICRLNGQLHVYRQEEGIYYTGYRYLENQMIQLIPTLKAAQRQETIKYLEILLPDNMENRHFENIIAFKNGFYNLATGELIEPSPDYIVTNKIRWNYNPAAYCERLDQALNEWACGDAAIRALLEECAGYCLYRRNNLKKAFILTGGGDNGKSVFLKVLEHMLGQNNYSVLDIGELDDRFSTSMLSGKLANIGDDISSDFLQGKTLAVFKKAVSGDAIKAENKGQDAFSFEPYTKMLFSANEMPRIKSKAFAPIKNRLIMIPFEAHFETGSRKRNSNLLMELETPDAMEYLIQLALKGLNRALNNGFTSSQKVQQQLDEYEKENTPLLGWLESFEDAEHHLLHEDVSKLFKEYETFCNINGHFAGTCATFSKQIRARFGYSSGRTVKSGKKYTFFTR